MLRTLTLDYRWANSFNTKPKLLNISCNFLKTVLRVKNNGCIGYRMVVSILAVHPRAHVAEWELQLTATAQHHEKVSYHIPLAWEKIKIKKCDVYFLLNSYRCGTIIKSKNLKSKHLSWRPSVHVRWHNLKYLWIYLNGRLLPITNVGILQHMDQRESIVIFNFQ